MLSISEYDTLFSIIGTTYGGDGQVTFALPNLQGRAALGTGNNYVLGEETGSPQKTLTVANLPTHNHTVHATLPVTSQPASVATPTNAYWGVTDNEYSSQAVTGVYMAKDETSITLAPTGSSQPLENMQPYLGLSFIISLYGIYPSQS